MSYNKFTDNNLDNMKTEEMDTKEIKESLANKSITNDDYISEESCQKNDESCFEHDTLNITKPFIGNIEDISEHDQHHLDNEFILKGYRINFHSFKLILKSLFLLHNETFNVWSHLSGCIVAIFLLIFTFCTISTYSLVNYKSLSGVFEIVNIEKMTIPQLKEYRNKFVNRKNYINLNKNITEIEIRTNIKFLNVILEGKNYIQNRKNKNLTTNELEEEFHNIHKFYKNNVLCVGCFQNIVNMNISENNLSVISKEFLNELGYETKSNELKNKDAKSNKEFYLLGMHENYLVTWPLIMIFVGGIVCLGFSSSFHLFAAHSCTVKRVFNRMDYAGIAILIMGSCYPPYYYYFYCNTCKNFINL